MAFEKPMNGTYRPSVGKMILACLLAISAIVWLWSDVVLKKEEKRNIGKAPLERHYITVSADDKLTVSPDLATIQVGLVSKALQVTDATNDNTKKFNAILAGLKSRGIAEKDIRTVNYSVTPNYDYTSGGTKFIGYVVNQSIEVKIRDLAKVGDTIATVTQLGANDVGGLQFTVENADAFQDQVRSSAIAKAKAKATKLASEAGFTLGKLVNFSEGGSAQPPIYYGKTADSAGMGGAGPVPSIQPGTQEIVSNVSLTYEIE